MSVEAQRTAAARSAERELTEALGLLDRLLGELGAAISGERTS